MKCFYRFEQSWDQGIGTLHINTVVTLGFHSWELSTATVYKYAYGVEF